MEKVDKYTNQVVKFKRKFEERKLETEEVNVNKIKWKIRHKEKLNRRRYKTDNPLLQENWYQDDKSKETKKEVSK